MSLKTWLLETESATHANAPAQAGEIEGPYIEQEHHHKTHPWWQVMCLTGVDYFSSLAYQAGIAALAAGAVAPIATLILVIITLIGAVPVYSRVARESPHGEGSVAMLEKLLRGWKGKLFVLVLLGFAATDFIITITLSAADASAHMVENPLAHRFVEGHEVLVTLGLIALLGGVFLKGFKEAIGIAVVLVLVYLGLNVITIGTALYDLAHHPEYITRWQNAVLSMTHSWPSALARAVVVFPALALGLSGFETGVAVMPLVEAKNGDIADRIKNTKRLLRAAAITMSCFLLTSSVATIFLIPKELFEKGGEANGRALAYLAHYYFGEGFGTVYDISTITILWFAGASAMAALLNLVPRYLPRYGMAPDWARASRPLAIVFSLVAFAVTIHFKANVDAQGAAYATGVLVLITSASVAATLSAKSKGQYGRAVFFAFIVLVFLYTTAQNIHERPEGLIVASFFIFSIVAISILSRVYRTTELRVDRFDIDRLARQFIDDANRGTVRIIANEPNERDETEYRLKEKEQREDNHIPPADPVIFAEVKVRDASDFGGVVQVSGEERFGYRILRIDATTIPNALAALMLHIRDTHNGKIPHIYFSWTEGNPLIYVLKYLAFGEGDVAPVTREVLREAEPDPEKRPGVHVGG
ncbi:amino acid transporter [bacterium]|nr:MAG: amino acid transporter [bacterium]